MSIVPHLSDSDYFGNSVKNSVLVAPKIGGAPASPEAGHFYMKNGVLYYRTAQNVERPVHEDAVNSVTSNTSALSAVVVGTSIVLEIDSADTSNDGLMPFSHYALIDRATYLPTADTLVVRDNAGGARFEGIEATEVYIDGNLTANDATFNGDVTANNISGLSSNQDNQDDTHAVSLGYFRTQLENVQSAIASRDFKENVSAALITNFDLMSAPSTYEGDGFSLSVGDSIALIGQTNPVQNGIYQITNDGWVRRADSANNTVMTPGAVYPVSEGALAGRLIMNVSPAGFFVDVDPLSFLVIDDSANAGDGLVKSGKTIHAVGTSGRIAVTADAIDIDSGYIGQDSITTLGTVTDAIWNADAIAITYGGTGATTAPAALTNLGAVQEETPIVLGDGVATSFSVASSLNNPAPTVEGFFLISGNWVKVPDLDVRVNNTTRAITIYAQQGANPIPANSLKVVVRGKKYQ